VNTYRLSMRGGTSASAEVAAGVVIREVRERGDFARIAQLGESPSGSSEQGWIDGLADEREADPESLRLFFAEAGDLTVSPTEPKWPLRAVAATSKSMPPTIAARYSSGSGSSR
jgi:hypothetical protein